MFTGFESVSIQSGLFKGVPGVGAPNVQRTNYVSYNGGTYLDMLRGPTVGANCQNITITNPIVKDMTFTAISIDVRDPADDQVNDGHAIVIGGNVEGCNRAIFTQVQKLRVYGLCSKNTSGTDATYRCTDTADAYFENCVATGEGTNATFQAGDGAGPNGGNMRFGRGNITDSTGGAPYDTGGTATMEFENSRTITASGDITMNDDVILVDTSSGAVDLDFPASSQIKASGKTWTIKVIDSTNNVTLTRQSGSGNINNGTIYTISSGQNYVEVNAVWNEDGTVYINTPELYSATTGGLNSVTNAINTTNKKRGKRVYNTSLNKQAFATGSADSDVWVDAQGATTNTPV